MHPSREFEMLIIQTLPASVSAEGKKKIKNWRSWRQQNPEEIHSTGTHGEEKGIQNEESFKLTKSVPRGKFPNKISRELLGAGTEHPAMRITPSITRAVQQYRKAIYSFSPALEEVIGQGHSLSFKNSLIWGLCCCCTA